MKNLYYFIHLTGRDEGNTGIQRVVRNLGRALQELKLPDLTIVPVRWSEEARSIVHVEPEFADVISRFGGPKFPPSGLAGSPIPQAQSDADWLLIPEVPHLGSHDPRYPSVQVGPVIACGKSLGLKVAAVFHDVLPLVSDAVIGEGELNQYRFMVYAQSLTNLDFIIPNSLASQLSLNDWLMAQGVSATRLARSLEIVRPKRCAASRAACRSWTNRCLVSRPSISLRSAPSAIERISSRRSRPSIACGANFPNTRCALTSLGTSIPRLRLACGRRCR